MHSAGGQSENPEHVRPDGAVPGENPAEVQPELWRRPLNFLHEVQTEGNTRDWNGHMDVFGTVKRAATSASLCLVGILTVKPEKNQSSSEGKAVELLAALF